MKSPQIAWISRDDRPDAFPPIDKAFDTPDGLLAAGGDLSPERLLYAYRHGIFPWFDDGQPILWWSPNPRCVLPPREFHLSRRLKRALRHSDFDVRFNTSFEQVIEGCAGRRIGQDGTWITTDMKKAYIELHRLGWAHSIEIWRAARLVGGLYGIASGQLFFGESMFSRADNASKAAMLALCRVLEEHRFALLDCQVESPHLLSLGAVSIPRTAFAATLQKACKEPSKFVDWPENARNISSFIAEIQITSLQ